MSRAPSLRRVRPPLSRLAWMLALPLLAGCAYDGGGYYDNGYGYPYGYGYGYPYDYGYGYGYPYDYGYGYYGAYGFFGGDHCSSWGCDDRHHHHDHDDNDNDDSHHHGGSDVGMNVHHFHPPESNVPRHFEQPNGGHFRNLGPSTPTFRAPAAPPPLWIPPQVSPKH